MSFSNFRRGFTLIELLVVIAIIALLAAILFPVFARARENARKTSCQNNLKQFGVGIAQYTQDFDEHYPMSEEATNPGNTAFSTTIVFHENYWPTRVMPYLKSRQIFRCPSTSPSSSNPAGTGDNALSYWAVGGLFRKPSGQPVSIADVLRAAEAPHLYDNLDALYEARLVFRPSYMSATTYHPQTSFTMTRKPVHLEAINVLYADGHVKAARHQIFYKQACPEWVPPGTTALTTCTLPTS